jgi:hypothetical protein
MTEAETEVETQTDTKEEIDRRSDSVTQEDIERTLVLNTHLNIFPYAIKARVAPDSAIIATLYEKFVGKPAMACDGPNESRLSVMPNTVLRGSSSGVINSVVPLEWVNITGPSFLWGNPRSSVRLDETTGMGHSPRK